MTLADELRGKRKCIRSKSRPVKPMGAWPIYDPDPEIRREEIDRIHWAKQNRRKRDARP